MTFYTQTKPADQLKLEVVAAVVTDAMRWDIDRWDRSRWDREEVPAGTLIFNAGMWNREKWIEETALTKWVDITGPCTHISVKRGVTTAGGIMHAQTGTLSVKATAELDPRAAGILYGAQIRLKNTRNGQPLFTGFITDIKVEPGKKASDTAVTIEAADAVAKAASITRYGARPDGGRLENWDARIRRLMGSAPNVSYEIPSTSYALVCPTVWETSLAAHLDAATATVGGAWYCDRQGTLQICAYPPQQYKTNVALTDSYESTGKIDTWHYTDAKATWQAENIVSRVEATVHDAAPNESGEWRAADYTAIAVEPTRSTAWGGATLKIDTMAPSRFVADEMAQKMLKEALDYPTVSAVSFWPVSQRIDNEQRQDRMNTAGLIDPLDLVEVIRDGDKSLAHITSVSHDITPYTWKTTLTLLPKEVLGFENLFTGPNRAR